MESFGKCAHRRSLTWCALPTLQLGGFAFIGEGIPVGLGAAFRCKYMKVRDLSLCPLLPVKLWNITDTVAHCAARQLPLSPSSRKYEHLQAGRHAFGRQPEWHLVFCGQLIAKCGASAGRQCTGRRCIDAFVASCLKLMLTTVGFLWQDALGADGEDNISVNFFGDGTANNGAVLAANCGQF